MAGWSWWERRRSGTGEGGFERVDRLDRERVDATSGG